MFLADFHVHSTFSDGKVPLPEVIDLYGRRGFGAIAITDHLCEKSTFLGIASRTIDCSLTTANYPIYLNMLETEQGFVASMEYNADLFNVDTIERMLEHFRILLEGIVANPAHPIATLPMLTEAERRQVLGQWNQTIAEPAAARNGDSVLDAADLDNLSDEELTALLRKLKS